MKVYEALARAFVAEGTRSVFTMMGDANIYWLNALAKLGVAIYEVRHEGAGLAMADGFGRVASEPGVCSTTSGPGMAQIATTMIVASRARTPLVAFCGDIATDDTGNAQRFDHARFAAAIEADFVRLTSSADAFAVVQRAFSVARSQSRPVILSAPVDLQEASVEDQTYVSSRSLDHEQAAARPDPSAIREAADLITSSTRPVIVLGRGAARARADASVRAIGARIGALFATTILAKNWLSEDEFQLGISGDYATGTARRLLRSADLVIAVGANLNQYSTDRGRLYGTARVIQIDTRPREELERGDRAACFLRGDGRLILEMLDAELASRGFRSIGLRTAAVRGEISRSWDDPATYADDPGTVDPREVCRVLDRAIPERFGLVLGSGQQTRFGTMLLRRPRPYVVAQHHFGCIGQGLLTAMGAVIATGMRPAFVLEGDGGFMMHLAEFETAVRYGLPLLVVVMNDQRLGAEFHKSQALGLDAQLAVIPTPDLGAVGTSMGARGTLVRSLDDLSRAVAEFVSQPTATLLDVRISPNVLSIPYRRAVYGEDV